MSWNHRVIKDGNSYAIHEVYYSDNDEIMASTQIPVGIEWEEGEDPIFTIDNMRRALDMPVLTFIDDKLVEL